MNRLVASCVVCIAFLTSTLHLSADAICKGARIPLNYVATGELNSPPCAKENEDPFVMNAWEVEKAHDGIVACDVPGYQTIGPMAASLVACGRVTSETCAGRLDGLPNATVLKSSNACANTTPLPANLAVHCTNDQGDDRVGTPSYGRKIGLAFVPQCPALTHWSSDAVPVANAWLYRKPAPTDVTLSVCADPTHDLPLRRFYNPNCTSLDRRATDDGLTGWIIMGPAFNPARGQSTVFCQRSGDFYDPLCGGDATTFNAIRRTWDGSAWR